MNFFEHQAKARSSSTRMVLLFALAVGGIVLAVDLAVLLLLGTQLGSAGGVAGALLVGTLGTLAVIGLGSMYRMASLRGGGESVALQMGATPVPEDTTDFQLRRLRNVVEEIAIASGVPVPKIYVIEHEAGINAFAAGYSPADAAVAVTRGALDRLNRDELQGVIAHEFSHILNGDMRLNIRLMGMLFGILVLASSAARADLRRAAVAAKERRRDPGAWRWSLMIVGYIGAVLRPHDQGRRVSRQRELLADASAVQFTRQTSGIAGALKKIAGLHEGSQLSDKRCRGSQPHAVRRGPVAVSALFATHPPLLERIRLLDPSFNEQQLQQLPRAGWPSPRTACRRTSPGLAGPRRPPPCPPPWRAQISVTPPMVVGPGGPPAEDDYRRAGSIVASLSPELRALAAQRESVMPLLLALLVDDDPRPSPPSSASKWPRAWAKRSPRRPGRSRDSTRSLHPMLRLPLASLAFPVLRLRPRPELTRSWPRSTRWCTRTARSRCSNTAWASCWKCRCANRWIPRAMRASADASPATSSRSSPPCWRSWRSPATTTIPRPRSMPT